MWQQEVGHVAASPFNQHEPLRLSYRDNTTAMEKVSVLYEKISPPIIRKPPAVRPMRPIGSSPIPEGSAASRSLDPSPRPRCCLRPAGRTLLIPHGCSVARAAATRLAGAHVLHPAR